MDAAKTATIAFGAVAGGASIIIGASCSSSMAADLPITDFDSTSRSFVWHPISARSSQVPSNRRLPGRQ